MKLSEKSKVLTPSEPRNIYDEAQKYSDVIDLTLGDPDLIPTENIREAAVEAIRTGKTRYSANAGLLELREAIAKETKQDYGISYDPESEVIVTSGAMEAVYLTLWTLLDPGDEVIVPKPYWVNYGEVIKSFGAIPVFVETTQENGFIPVPSEIEKVITERTKLLTLISPSNPTAAVIPPHVLDQLAEIAVKHDLTVISDEIYSHLVFDGKRAESIVTRDGMRERTVIINGCSKRFAMTGWRIGWSLGPADLIRVMTQMSENIASCATLPSQYAAIEALSERTDKSYVRREFEQRRNYILEELKTIPEISCVGIPATFYGFLDISETGMTDEDFVFKLLEEKQVALIPGSAYGGDSYRKFVRIAFTVSIPVLQEAFRRIREFLANR